MITARISKLLAKYEFFKPLAVFVIALASFGYIGCSWYIADPDSFYHIKMAILMSRHGIIYNFPYLPFTVLKNIFIDHHLLYHAIMIPFVSLMNPIVGAKILQAILASLVVLVFYFLLRKWQIKFPLFFALALLVSPAFVFRMSLIKAQPLSIIILLIGLFLILKRKKISLAILSFIYVWTYGGWIFLPVICLIFVFIDALDSSLINSSLKYLLKYRNFIAFIKNFIINLFSRKNILLIFSCWLGALAGLIINPYFPHNISFYFIQAFQIPFLVGGKVNLGTEWHAISQTSFFTNLFFQLLILCLSLAMTHLYRPKLDLKSKLLLTLSILFILATLKSQRNSEYLTPIAILTSALLFTLSLKTSKFREDAEIFRQKILPYMPLKLWAIFIIFISLICISGIAINVKIALGQDRFDNFEKASTFISTHSEPGDIIYHSSWDQFPALFYFNDENRYISGLDPTFLYLADKTLYEKMNDLSLGKRGDEAYTIIKVDFHAKYIFTAPRWTKFISNINKDPKFQKVYSDPEAIIYKVL